MAALEVALRLLHDGHHNMSGPQFKSAAGSGLFQECVAAMRYAKGHKEATRRQIAKVASERFRRDGVEAVGVASLMADAGLTHGGFYSHFDSKEALVRAATAEALQRGRAQLARAGAEQGIEGIVRAYLRPTHRDAPARGCVFASLAPDIARASSATRAALTQEFEAHIDLIASYLPKADRGRSMAMFSLMMGALQLSRMVSDEALSDDVLRNAAHAALSLATASPSPREAGRGPR